MQLAKKILFIIFCLFLGQEHAQGTELPHLPSNCPSYEFIWQNWNNLQEVDNQVVWEEKNFQVLKITRPGECKSHSITLKALNYPLSPRYSENFENICAYGLKCDGILHQVIVVGEPRKN